MSGAKQPHPFDPARAARLDDPAREAWLPSDALVERLELQTAQSLLDFGAGTARYALAAARANPALHVTAFDLQPEMAALARTRVAEAGAGGIDVTTRLDPKARYDRVLACNLLHEIDDDTLRRLASAVAPRGFALVVDWDADRAHERDFGPPAEHTHTIEEALQRLRLAGLRAQRIPEPRFPYHFAIAASSP